MLLACYAGHFHKQSGPLSTTCIQTHQNFIDDTFLCVVLWDDVVFKDDSPIFDWLLGYM